MSPQWRGRATVSVSSLYIAYSSKPTFYYIYNLEDWAIYVIVMGCWGQKFLDICCLQTANLKGLSASHLFHLLMLFSVIYSEAD